MRILGAGQFGEVYLATQKTKKGEVYRAVKLLRDTASAEVISAVVRVSADHLSC